MKNSKAIDQHRRRRDLRRDELLSFECLEQRQMLAIDLDPTFGVGGITPHTNFGAPYGLNASTSVVADGDKVVVAATSLSDNPNNYSDGAHLILARYAANGALDTTFGANHTGVVEVDTVQLAPGSTDHASLDAATYQPVFVTTMTVNGDKKYVAVATKESTAFVFFGIYVREAASIVVARFNSDGTPDTTFAPTGAKQILTPPGSGYISASGVTIDGQKIVIGARCTFAFSSATPGNHAVAIRLTENGDLDTTFDGDGYALAPLSQIVSFDGNISGVAVDGQHNVILAGSYLPSNSVTRPQILRFTASGALDATFGTGGRFLGNFGVNESATSPVVDSSGRITFGTLNYGNVGPGFHIVRLLGAGLLDPSFGTAAVDQANGAASDGYDGSTYYLGTDEHNAPNVAAVAQALAIDPAGSVVVAGYAGDSLNSRFAMTRLTDSGAFDSSFHGGRMILTDVAPPTPSSPPYINAAYSITFDAHNRTVLGGVLLNIPITAGGLTLNTSDIALARYSDGGGPANNFPPTATNDSPYFVDKNNVLNVPARGVLVNDSDPEGATLTAVRDTDASHGQVVLNSDGSFTYTPNPGYFGADSFTYHASDGTNSSNIATVSITVVNHKPVGASEFFFVDAGGKLDGAVLTNDFDVDADTITAVLNSGPSHAANFSLDPDGSFHYEPATGYLGPDSFTYKPSDGELGAAVTVSITVTPPPGPFQVGAGADWYIPSFSAYSGGSVQFVLFDLNADGSVDYTLDTSQPLSRYQSIPWSVLAAAGLHELSSADAPYDVDVALTVFSLNNGVPQLTTPPLTTLTVAPRPQTVYVNPRYEYDFHNPSNQTWDPDDNTSNGGTNGPATLVGYDAFPDIQMAIDAVSPGGLVSIAPDVYFIFGQDGSVNSVIDNHGKAVTLEVTPDAANHQVIVNNGFLRLDSAATLRIRLEEGQPLNGSFPFENHFDQFFVTRGVILNGPTLELVGAHTFFSGDAFQPLLTGAPFPISPLTGLQGAFGNVIDDAQIQFSGQTLIAKYERSAGVRNNYFELHYKAPPTSMDDFYSTVHDRALHIDAPAGVLANDSGSLPLHAVYQFGPIHGLVDLQDDGSFDYTPNAGFSGTDSFTYRVSDGTSLSSVATVTILVDDVAPVTADDFYSVTEDSALSVNKFAADSLVSNDNDDDGDSVTVVIQSLPSHGSLVLDADGITFTYTPDVDYFGEDSFTYRAFDGVKVSNGAAARVVLTVEPINDTPTIAADHDAATGLEGGTLTNAGVWADVDLTAGDRRLDHVFLTTDYGMVTQNNDGTWSWTGPARIAGPLTATITATDDDGETATVTFDLVVQNVPLTVSINGLPNGAVDEGRPIVLTAVANGADSELAAYQWYVNGVGVFYSVGANDFVFTPPDGGSYVIEVDVTSPASSTPGDEELAFAVSDPIQVQNLAPVISLSADEPTGLDILPAGSTGHYVVTVSQANPADAYDSPNVSVHGGGALDSGPTFDAQANVWRFSVLYSTASLYSTIDVQVTDDDGEASSPAHAVVQITPRAGTLDTSFDGDGKLSTPAGIGQKVVIQNDGRIVVASRQNNSDGLILRRYLPDGTLDETFGVRGVVRTRLLANSRGLLLTDDGKILVAAFDGARSTIARYTGRGVLDDTFGQHGLATNVLSQFDVFSIALQGEKILAIGNKRENAFVARLNSDGSTDTAFAANGLTMTDLASAQAIKVLDDGAFYITGARYELLSLEQFAATHLQGGLNYYGADEGVLAPVDFFVQRFLANGSPDTGFGQSSKAIVDLGQFNEVSHNIAVQSDGKILLTGSTPENVVVVRLTASGQQLDSAFGTAGKATLELMGALRTSLTSRMAIQNNGKILVTGVADALGRYQTIVRLNADGAVDGEFADHGVANIAYAPDARVATLAVQTDGRILIIGGDGFALNTQMSRLWGDSAAFLPPLFIPGSTGSNDTLSIDLAHNTYNFSAFPFSREFNGTRVINFDGGGVDGEVNLLSINAGRNDVVNIPDPVVKGKGVIITSTGLRINYSNLTPIDVDSASTFTLVLPNADDAIQITPDFNTAPTVAGEAAGTVPALKIAGTSGGVGFEQAHVFRTSRIVIDTTDNDGNDTISVAASNAHGNGSLEIHTGAGADVVSFEGGAKFADGILVDSQLVYLDSDLKAANVALDAAAIALGHSTGDVAIDGNLTAIGTLYVDINGSAPGSDYQRIRVSGTADLSALALHPNFGGGYTPPPGDVIEVVRAGAGVTPLTSLAEGAAVGAFTAHYTNTQLALVGRAANQPNVVAARLASTAWTQDFKNYVDGLRGAGPGVGYVAAVGEASAIPVPWINVNQIALTFDRPIHKAAGGDWTPADVTVRGVAGDYTVSNIAYEAATRTLLVTLDEVLPVDKILVAIAAATLVGDDLTAPTDDVTFRFNVLPGDADRDGMVQGSDVGQVRLKQFGQIASDAALDGYGMFADLDGSGAILGNDVGAARLRQFTELPPGEPAAFAAAALHAAIFAGDESLGEGGAAPTIRLPVLEAPSQRAVRSAYRPAMRPGTAPAIVAATTQTQRSFAQARDSSFRPTRRTAGGEPTPDEAQDAHDAVFGTAWRE